jgi:trehalose synthase
MSGLLTRYEQVAGPEAVNQLRQLAAPLKGTRLIHVSSTREGGGVAEILSQLVPLQEELGLKVDWLVLEGNAAFFNCTKNFHNGLQGTKVSLTDADLTAYEATNQENAQRLRGALKKADVVLVHDPQPAALLKHTPNRSGRWIWRCHIDVSHPQRRIWRYLREFIKDYDASIFSLADFARPLPHSEYIIPPAINPFSEKNCDIAPEELQEVAERFQIDRHRPLLVQVSRFDRFKDPLGVIEAYRLVKRFIPGVQLVLAGGGATDDPEGETVLREVRAAAGEDSDIHVLMLPSDAHRTINALQRLADIVLQKSIKEGFGLTVTEALWKGKPVVGGDTGGIRLQVVNHHTGFLVNSPEGAALRIRYLLQKPEMMKEIGSKAREYVRENFLLTRLLREHLTLLVSLLHRETERIDTTSWKS